MELDTIYRSNRRRDQTSHRHGPRYTFPIRVRDGSDMGVEDETSLEPTFVIDGSMCGHHSSHFLTHINIESQGQLDAKRRFQNSKDTVQGTARGASKRFCAPVRPR